jgi:Tfp pilus assembly protein PilO
MGRRNADRIWMAGGLVLATLLLAAGWFFAISPQNAEADDLRAQSEDTETRLITLRHRLAELEEQKSQLPKFQAQLAVNKKALPTGSGVPDFLRQLQDSGDAVDVIVSAFTVGSPELQAGNTTVYALPITVTASGSADDLGRFLNQLQAKQPRAVLVEAASLTAAGGEAAQEQTLALTLKAFVAPGAGQPAPTVSATS